MHTISINIEESKVDIVLNLLKHLKDDIIESYSVSPQVDKNLEIDPYFYKRKERLLELRENMGSGKMPMYDFDASMDELIRELES
jgi:hypothetical protein